MDEHYFAEGFCPVCEADRRGGGACRRRPDPAVASQCGGESTLVVPLSADPRISAPKGHLFRLGPGDCRDLEGTEAMMAF
ncbi:MAG TPA: hypothetical protein PK874_02070 [Desulfobacteraceae bacterium]|nr:hypothetical protein [Desulfobacteraceae bacterium]HPJ66368.1 hypothetical protein [Desulfobacteraceae bacterium]